MSTSVDLQLPSSLTPAQRSQWERRQFLIFPEALSPDALAQLRAETEALCARPETPGKWMRYYEESEEGEERLCRLENFLPWQPWLAELLLHPAVMGLLEELFEEPACLFKEKINLKSPGGAGFTAHQDAPAFRLFGQDLHITLLVAIDPSLADNGGLEMGPPCPAPTLLPQAEDGTLHPDWIAEAPWELLEVPAGSLVFFDSYVPHRSGPNLSPLPRRALYVTYNALSQGDRRADYFREKRAAFPPDCEREEGTDYSQRAGSFNLGNPIR